MSVVKMFDLEILLLRSSHVQIQQRFMSESGFSVNASISVASCNLLIKICSAFHFHKFATIVFRILLE